MALSGIGKIKVNQRACVRIVALLAAILLPLCIGAPPRATAESRPEASPAAQVKLAEAKRALDEDLRKAKQAFDEMLLKAKEEHRQAVGRVKQDVKDVRASSGEKAHEVKQAGHDTIKAAEENLKKAEHSAREAWLKAKEAAQNKYQEALSLIK